MNCSEEYLRPLLGSAQVIAVVGASPNPARPSHTIMRFLLDQGYRVIPIRPKVSEILGQPCYGSLAEIPAEIKVDIVDVFRKAEACPGVAQAAVELGAKALWLQEGIVSEEAAAIAASGGLDVIMDCCILKVRRRL